MKLILQQHIQLYPVPLLVCYAELPDYLSNSKVQEKGVNYCLTIVRLGVR